MIDAVECKECLYKNECCKCIEFMREDNEDEYDHDQYITACSFGKKEEINDTVSK